MREGLSVATQDRSAPREQVLAGFADPANLERLPPPWVAFEILTPPPLPRGKCEIFAYRRAVLSKQYG